MAGTSRREDTLHNPSVSLGERLQRKLQWVASRRTAQRRDFLHPYRSKGADRSLVLALQHDPPPQQLGLSTTSPRSSFVAIATFRFRFAPPLGANSNRGANVITNHTYHLVGAGQRHHNSEPVV